MLQRRKAERALARTEADLLQSQKMDAIGRLAGGIAHDFNNLLTIINGHAALLRETPGELASHDAEVSVDEIEKAGNQAAGLTRQLLAFSRKQILQACVVNLNQIVRALDSMLGRLIGERIALTTELDPQLLNLSVDPVQIQQAIVNLVVKARDAMPDGGRIVIGTRNADRLPAAAGAIDRGGPCVALTVTDTGQRQSGRRSRAILTIKPEGKGSWVAMVTASCERRWTDVSAVGDRPEPGPMAESPMIRTGAARVPARVLVVEDQPEVRDLAVSASRRAGYDVSEATDGDEAFARFGDRAGTVGLLLTDVVMPGMNGREVAERLRARNPQLLVLFMSGYTDEILDQREFGRPGRRIPRQAVHARGPRQADRSPGAVPSGAVEEHESLAAAISTADSTGIASGPGVCARQFDAFPTGRLNPRTRCAPLCCRAGLRGRKWHFHCSTACIGSPCRGRFAAFGSALR